MMTCSHTEIWGFTQINGTKYFNPLLIQDEIHMD